MYALTGAQGLGATYTLNVAGQSIDVNIPFEQVAQQAATIAINAAMPALKQQIPGLISSAMPAITQQIPTLLKAAEPTLEDYIVNRLWPVVVKPELAKEIGVQTTTATGEAKHVALIAGGVAVAGTLAFLLFRKKKVA